MPDFANRFWVYALYDARTGEFGDRHALRHQAGFLSDGRAELEGRASTELAFTAPRIFKDDNAEDSKAVQPVLGQIMFYPLSQFDGKMKATDWSKVPRFPVPAGTDGRPTLWLRTSN